MQAGVLDLSTRAIQIIGLTRTMRSCIVGYDGASSLALVPLDHHHYFAVILAFSPLRKFQ
ncbi:hypothetical protein DHODJN_00520 [Methylorubrum extorquens]